MRQPGVVLCRRRRHRGWTPVLGGLTALVLSGCAGGHGGPAVATFTGPPTATSRQLAEDVHQLLRRLQVLGDRNAIVESTGNTIVVTGTTGLPVPAAALIAPGMLQFRPVLCAAGPYTASAKAANTVEGPLPLGCSSGRYSLEAPNLVISPSNASANGYSSNLGSIAADPTLADRRSTTAAANVADTGRSVLLPLAGGDGSRYLLGPAELNGGEITSATATYEAPVWVVDARFSTAGAVGWDELNQRYFHEMIGFDLDGRLLSVPVVQPNLSSFSSFAGRTKIAANFSRRAAEGFAAVLDSGPLVTPLRIAR
ncbi:MAG TPA: hypothetical protein VNC61_16190 [Acidimicrobiales bacterium]|nr:hypothetical protein [Acidimicrobiales bacterium]